MFDDVVASSAGLSLRGTCPLTSDVKASRPDWRRGQNFGLDKILASISVSASSIWPRPGLVLVNLASKMCYPVQNNIACIHFVVVSLQVSLCYVVTFLGTLMRE